MHIEIDAPVRSATIDFLLGVGGMHGPGLQYILSTSSTGRAALLKEVDDNPGEATVLTWSDERGTTRQMHFTLEVRGGGTAPTQLVG